MLWSGCVERRRAVKEAMALVWQRIYESNYHKSLDHRSFYFKQVRLSKAFISPV